MFDLYEEITKQILEMLEQGIAPWRSPILGRGKAGQPKNIISNKPYRGVNIFLLAFTAYVKGYGSSYWMTYKQAQERGGNIRKGEQSTMVVFWKQYDTEDRITGDPKRVPVMRYYRLFNADQTENVKVPDAVAFTPIEFTPVDEAEKIIAGYADGPAIEHGGTQAFYRPSTDSIQMPEPTRFASIEEYYSTRFHEMAHSTGHSKRLGRGIDTDTQPFGSAAYGREELIAEMTAAFLSAEAGIAPPVIANQAAYLAGWIKTLKGDKKLVVSAAGQAQKASDWILGQRLTAPVQDD